MISKQEHEKTRELETLSNAHNNLVYSYDSELDLLVDLCCDAFRIKYNDFMSPWRKREVAECRQVFFFMAKNYVRFNYTLYAVQSISDRLESEDNLNDICGDILSQFKRFSKW
jgi:chromosomal replication initiation ATPase DnaA